MGDIKDNPGKMKNLWTPWRMDYILADKEGRCFLCDAAESGNDREALVISRRDGVFALLNLYPYNNGHVLIAPFGHVADIGELEAGPLMEMMTLLVEIKEKLDSIMCPHGYNIGLNLGKAAGAGLAEHLHMHIVPRWEGDTNFMPVFGETKVIPQHLEEVWEQLVEMKV